MAKSGPARLGSVKVSSFLSAAPPVQASASTRAVASEPPSHRVMICSSGLFCRMIQSDCDSGMLKDAGALRKNEDGKRMKDNGCPHQRRSVSCDADGWAVALSLDALVKRPDFLAVTPWPI